MSDKLSNEELAALRASTEGVSPNSIAYNLHIRSKLARGCFYGLNLCALAFLFVSGTDLMEDWLNLVNAPPEEGVTELQVRTLLVFLFFLWVNLAKFGIDLRSLLHRGIGIGTQRLSLCHRDTFRPVL